MAEGSDQGGRARGRGRVREREASLVEKTGRKREVRREEWKEKKAKELRNLGKEYQSARSGKKIVARKIGSPCPDGCFEKVGEEACNAIFNGFWELGDYNKQNAYISQYVRSVPVKRKRKKDSVDKMRYQYTVKYLDETFIVCRRAFLSIHDISEKRLKIQLKRMKDSPTGTPEGDKRGRKPNPRKITGIKKARVHEHIESLPTTSSQYTRDKSQLRKYLPANTTIKKLYNQYEIWMKEFHQDEDIVTCHYYADIFTNCYNRPPQKDTCTTCDGLNAEIARKEEKEEDSSSLKSKLKEHKTRTHLEQRLFSSPARKSKEPDVEADVSEEENESNAADEVEEIEHNTQETKDDNSAEDKVDNTEDNTTKGKVEVGGDSREDNVEDAAKKAEAEELEDAVIKIKSEGMEDAVIKTDMEDAAIKSEEEMEDTTIKTEPFENMEGCPSHSPVKQVFIVEQNDSDVDIKEEDIEEFDPHDPLPCAGKEDGDSIPGREERSSLPRRKVLDGVDEEFMLEPTDAKLLIGEVKRHPVLWDTTRKDFSNSELTSKSWKNISSKLVDDYDDASAAEQGVMREILQIRWEHLRNIYEKEIEEGKSPEVKGIREWQDIKKQLSFLPKVIENGGTAGEFPQKAAAEKPTSRKRPHSGGESVQQKKAKITPLAVSKALANTKVLRRELASSVVLSKHLVKGLAAKELSPKRKRLQALFDTISAWMEDYTEEEFVELSKRVWDTLLAIHEARVARGQRAPLQQKHPKSPLSHYSNPPPPPASINQSLCSKKSTSMNQD